ncbi:hypothetical protein SLA2020_219010 [Shorea laevis]
MGRMEISGKDNNRNHKHTTTIPNFQSNSKKWKRKFRKEKENLISPEEEGANRRRSDYTGRWTTSVEGGVEAETEEEMEEELVNMRGRSWDSESSTSSEVERLMQEQRSSDAKKAVATLVPNHDAMYDKYPL